MKSSERGRERRCKVNKKEKNIRERERKNNRKIERKIEMMPIADYQKIWVEAHSMCQSSLDNKRSFLRNFKDNNNNKPYLVAVKIAWKRFPKGFKLIKDFG